MKYSTIKLNYLSKDIDFFISRLYIYIGTGKDKKLHFQKLSATQALIKLSLSRTASTGYVPQIDTQRFSSLESKSASRIF